MEKSFHAPNVTGEIASPITRTPPANQMQADNCNNAFCVLLLRTIQTGALPSFFPQAERIEFPQQCPVCNATADLREIKVKARGGFNLKFLNKVQYCRAHARSCKLFNLIVGTAVLVGTLVGFVSMIQKWLVVGPVEVSLVVYPIAFGIFGWILYRIVAWLLFIEDLSHWSTAPVEVLEIGSRDYVMAFHNRVYFDQFLELNSSDVIENLGEIEIKNSISIEPV